VFINHPVYTANMNRFFSGIQGGKGQKKVVVFVSILGTWNKKSDLVINQYLFVQIYNCMWYNVKAT
jgi:hypothetical protein